MQVSRTVAFAAAALFFLAALPGTMSGSKAAATSPDVAYEFHSVLPLGSDMFVVDGKKGSVLLLASAVSPQLEGWRRINQGGSRFLYTADGQRVRTYPEHVQFRVTASALDRAPGDDYDPVTVKTSLPLNDYLLGLQFQVRIFHGLKMQVVSPAEVHMLGVPADIPYNERIYRVSFDLPQVPVQDRMVLEVLAPDGTRLSRFHYELE